MNLNYKLLSLLFCFLLSIVQGHTQTKADPITFTVSMEKPSTHYFHIEMEYNAPDGKECLLKMPIWTPGYYWRLNFAEKVLNFSVENSNGEKLNFEKTDLETWKINTSHKESLKISYDVFAYAHSIAEPFLDDGRAFISPTGIFMFPDKCLNNSVVVKVKPYKEWTSIHTGLSKVKGVENTWYAKDYDELYDCPFLAGNMKSVSFDLDGIPYTIVMEKTEGIDLEKYKTDFKKIAQSATHLIGDVPYDHYDFLIMDKGMGGLEHRNSMAVFTSLYDDVSSPEAYKRWLSFIAHEFFHLYNVKTIRPIDLGPFDYCNENLTHMLWVAEGFTVYYEYMVLNRANLMTRQDVLDSYSKTFATFENAPGRKYMTARQSSYDTWLNFFSRSNHTVNTTISYYDIGCAMGMFLDLKIRHETNNQKSLEDVMRTIYYDFHKKQHRGYTDDEFRKVCEDIAGCSLEEIFHYGETTEPMDYQKYLDYAGVDINLTPEKHLSYGLDLRKEGDAWIITNIDRNSPAWKNGVSIDDKIITINGKNIDENLIKELEKPGLSKKITLQVERRTGKKELTISTFEKDFCNYKMQVRDNLSDQQKKTLNEWIRP